MDQQHAPATTLIAYSTVDGHTQKICARLRERLEAQGQAVTLCSIDDAANLDPAAHARVVIGASIRYGKHRPNVVELIRRHADVLATRPGVFFSVNLVARKPNRDVLENNNYAKKLLRQVPWQPDIVRIFAGELNYPKYGFWDRQVIRLIMWMTGGPTNADAVVDYTDWDKVDALADEIAALPQATPAA